MTVDLTLPLTKSETGVLIDLLDRHLGDMSSEIAATDNPAFRLGLRERRDLLRGIRDRLAAAPVGR